MKEVVVEVSIVDSNGEEYALKYRVSENKCFNITKREAMRISIDKIANVLLKSNNFESW